METIKIENEQLKVHVGSRRFLAPHEILYLESNINYTQIYLVNGQTFLSSTTLKIIENRLLAHHNFMRVNHGCIINQDYLKPNEKLCFTLPDKRTVAFSRRKAKAYLAVIY